MGATNAQSDSDRYVAVHDSDRFKDLRRQSQTFIRWASLAFMGWWFLTVLLGALAPEFYGTAVFGNVNVGLVFVLVTFALALVIIPLYLRFARTRLDPLAEQIRAELEGESR